MLQVCYLDVVKVDLVLHMLQYDSPAAAGDWDPRGVTGAGAGVWRSAKAERARW
jgi:hypothetical protein